MARHAADAAIGLNRHTALLLAARAALWARDAAALNDLLASLRAEPSNGRATAGGLRTLEAGAAGLAESAGAPNDYERAIAAWRELDLPLPLLLTLVERDAFVGSSPEAGREAERLMGRLQAKGLERLTRRTTS